MNLTKTSWPGGWNPSSDNINGDPNSLLRMDNLQQEQNGAIGLVRDFKEIGSQFADIITDIHSKSFNGLDYIWVGLNNGRSVKEIAIDGTQRFTGDILSGGGTKPVLDDVYGFLIACSGSQRVKWDGVTPYLLGLETPKSGPTGFVVPAQTIELTPAVMGGEWVLDEGHDLTTDPATGPDGSTPINTGADGNPNEIVAYADPTTLRSIIELDFTKPSDLLSIGGQQSSVPNNDTFSMDVQLHDSSAFDAIRVIFLLDAAGNNYYWYEWDIASSTSFNAGIDQWSTISATRGVFNRQGDDATLDWTKVVGIVVQVNALSDTWFGISVPRITGGVEGQLYGCYQYIFRYCMDMGSYVAKGAWSPPSSVFTCVNGGIQVLAPRPTVPEVVGSLHRFFVEIARTSVPSISSFYDGATGISAPLPDLLDQYYYVGMVPWQAIGTYFFDTMSDVDVLELDTPANLFLLSVQDITEPINDIVTSYNSRTFYITPTLVYISDSLNPDSVDVRYTLKPSGTPIDVNLWCKKVSNSMLVLGSTSDLYEINGTLASLPDGTIDINIITIGEKFPPISYDAALADGYIFYVAADGVRLTTGSNSAIISNPLAQLFRGLNCHGIPPINIQTGGIVRYPISTGHNKLYVALPHTDGEVRIHIYDLLNKTWTLQQQNASALCTTQSNNILLANGNTLNWSEWSSNYVSQSGLPINLLTVFDANGQPRNRKDTFTLKLVIDTGNSSISLYIGKDGGALQFVQNIQANGLKTIYVEMKNFNLGFRYQMQLIGATNFIHLEEYTIEYDPRPEQLNYIRISNSNLGSTGRKRLVSIPLVLDTLLGTVRFTPIIDNVLQNTHTDFTTLDQKETHVHYFLANTVGTDFGGILESLDLTKPFEFSGLDFGKAVSEAMPAPAEYLLIPTTNFGAPNRKRCTSFKFDINTRGQNVTFTPYINGSALEPLVVNSLFDLALTMEYFIDPTIFDPTFIDFHAELAGATPFEFYGQIIPQNMETFPPRLESLFVAETNFGSATRKRIRTLPIIINTNGVNLTFTPYVDGVPDTPLVFSTIGKRTVYYYFEDDSFGIDYGAWINAIAPFEFYGMETPVNVEILPSPKKYDQLGPLRFDKIGKLLAFRLRLLMIGTTVSLPYQILGDDETSPTYDSTVLYEGTINVVPGKDLVYQVNMPKSINGTVMRIILGPTSDPFHRFDLQARVQYSGMETDAKWVPMR